MLVTQPNTPLTLFWTYMYIQCRAWDNTVKILDNVIATRQGSPKTGVIIKPSATAATKDDQVPCT